MDNMEVIEKYIDGELEDSELINFENLLSNDETIERNYNLSKEINNSILEEDVMALRATMEYMFTEDNQVKRVPNIFAGRRKYYAAASIALLVAAGGLFQRFNSRVLENRVLYETYYSPYEATITYRSGNTEVDRVLLKAMEHYEEQDFENALVLFEKVLQKDNQDMAVSLYAGISYLEEEKYQKASKSFNKIIINNDNLFIDQAKWYLSMCYIKTGKTIEAKEILTSLINENAVYKERAKKVLKHLN